VTLEIQTKQGPRSILKTCSGIARPGEIVALMGPSGCGKTTLLNILSGRINATRGSLLANGAPLTSSFARISGYVTQDDIFLGNLTVREQLTYAALLRLPKAMTRAQKLERVDKILIELGLSSCAETRIGTELVRGVSGGEKKRVNIATELLSQPSILFLDEPTSGLDAFTSLALMQTLRHVAASGCTVVMSIHQPRADIFHAFDSVMLLSAGETVYFGRGSAAMMDWFAAHGATCPPLSNPADYYSNKEGGVDLRA
jgi:ABC-type multidrug transport system ATPase subunit